MNNPDFGRRFFPERLARHAQPFNFLVDKTPNTVRVFVLGESAAMGDPDLKFGLPRMLEVLLKERYPDKSFEVINAAVVAINSHVILPIARDCAQHQGDLWVVYMGNNEVVGPFGSASVFGARAPGWPVVRAGLWLKTLRLGQLLDDTLQRVRSPSAAAQWSGMEMMAGQQVRHDSRASQRVYGNFQKNLDDLLTIGARAGARIILCALPSNLKDCAPFASAHRTDLKSDQLADWESAYSEGVTAENGGDWARADAAFDRATQIDGEFADLAFRRADCLRMESRASEAAKFYTIARDEDALQFRADNRINEILRQAASKPGAGPVRLLDAEALFTTNSPQGLVGNEYFYEHVHLTPDGNYLLARAVAEQAAAALGLDAGGKWLSREECFHRLGLTDWNRYDALNTILDRIQRPPFTSQLNHTQQVQMITEQLARYRLATKPAQLKREVSQLAQLVARYPEEADLRWNLATLLQDSGDRAGAEQQWRAVRRLQPQSALAAYNLARLLEAMGRQAEAQPLYAESVRLKGDFALLPADSAHQ